MKAQLIRAIDGDTAEFLLKGQPEIVRFHSVDCEESAPGLGKPMTVNGVKAKHFTTEQLKSANEVLIELDFPREYAEVNLEEAIATSRDKYGRLIAHIYIDGLHLNKELIQQGYSPYFNKYGNSRLYHLRFEKAQAIAQAQRSIIWKLEANQGEYSRDYNFLLPWWNQRAAVVDLARFSSVNGGRKVWACDNECSLITKLLLTGKPIHALVDFQNPLQLFRKGSALKVRAGEDLLRVFLPNQVLQSQFDLIEQLRLSKNYGIVQGTVEQYRGIPQLTVTEILQ